MTAMALYSASKELLEMVCCFFDFQEIRDSPRYMEKLVTNFLVSGQVAQSKSLYAFNWIELWLGKKMSWPGAFLRYLRILKVAY